MSKPQRTSVSWNEGFLLLGFWMFPFATSQIWSHGQIGTQSTGVLKTPPACWPHPQHPRILQSACLSQSRDTKTIWRCELFGTYLQLARPVLRTSRPSLHRNSAPLPCWHLPPQWQGQLQNSLLNNLTLSVWRKRQKQIGLKSQFLANWALQKLEMDDSNILHSVARSHMACKLPNIWRSQGLLSDPNHFQCGDLLLLSRPSEGHQSFLKRRDDEGPRKASECRNQIKLEHMYQTD